MFRIIPSSCPTYFSLRYSKHFLQKVEHTLYSVFTTKTTFTLRCITLYMHLYLKIYVGSHSVSFSNKKWNCSIKWAYFEVKDEWEILLTRGIPTRIWDTSRAKKKLF